MTQRLLVNDNCTECRTCELKCSIVHFGLFNPNKSGVRIVSNWPDLPHARVCRQCADPACLPACPVEALVHTDSGVVQVRYDECTGCGSCVDACPYDGIWLDPLSGVAVKCDTCDGRFECVAYCFAGALSASE
ncbi:MAG: 4Fe-4S dicluster domain-containing protein [Chloroflexi bacterium]|nr:4Fe-4S dicluster domain-containing protein [Chloroflexota bacterium]MBU1746516.1 4Fe-4S dicluster domain-containing protein [Chloroflexota bacterium]MBU1877606.1 4Fe-4S dicluster domain-containing protein [Chloroflexota bacterium]